MFFNVFDPTEPENVSKGIELFSGDDKFFRCQFSPDDYADLQRYKFDNLRGALDWQLAVGLLPRVVFIDLGDILRYIRQTQPGMEGYSAIDIETIAEIACDFHGNDSSYMDVLWQCFEEETASVIQAALGVTEETGMLESGPFNDTMAVLYEIIITIQAYLVNARFPLIEDSSVYTVGDYRNGIIGLRLRTWKEVKEAFASEY